MYTGPHIVTKDLGLAFDFTSPRCWAADSTTVYDLTTNGNNATVNGSPAMQDTGTPVQNMVVTITYK